MSVLAFQFIQSGFSFSVANVRLFLGFNGVTFSEQNYYKFRGYYNGLVWPHLQTNLTFQPF